MSLRFRFVVLLSFLLWCSPLAARDLVFAPLPLEPQETILRDTVPLLQYLEKALQQNISLRFTEDYGTLLEEIQQEKIDLTLLGPLPYVQLRERYAAAEPVVRFLEADGKDTYTCALIASAEQPPADLAALKNKRIALTQPLSTCGYLFVNDLLRQAGLAMDATQFRYAGNHQEVALSIVRGEFDAGGIKTSIGKKYIHLGLRILAVSEPFPGFILVANRKTVSPEQIRRIREAMLRLDPSHSQQDQELTRSWGKDIRHGAIEASDSDYNGIRSMLQGTILPERGNY